MLSSIRYFPHLLSSMLSTTSSLPFSFSISTLMLSTSTWRKTSVNIPWNSEASTQRFLQSLSNLKSFTWASQTGHGPLSWSIPRHFSTWQQKLKYRWFSTFYKVLNVLWVLGGDILYLRHVLVTGVALTIKPVVLHQPDPALVPGEHLHQWELSTLSDWPMRT